MTSPVDQPPRVPSDDSNLPVDESWAGVRDRLGVLWQAGRVVLGVLLLVAGVLGTLLPVIPGIPLLIAGVALLGRGHWLVKPIADRIDRWRGATP